MIDLGELTFFFWIKITRFTKCLALSQRKYAIELVSDLELSACKTFRTPIEPNLKLTSKSYD